MDENKNKIHLVRSGGRRVTDTTTEYDWAGLEKRMERENKKSSSKSARPQNKKSAPRKRSAGAATLKKRVGTQKKQKQRRMRMKRRRMLLGLCAAAAVVIIILFLTPIFNIRSVTVEGNSIVPAEQFNEVLSPLVEQNLLRTGSGKIRRMLREIPYINTVDVQKKLFPPSVKVTVTEYSPAALIRAEGVSLIVNSKLHVLSDTGEAPYRVPNVTGVSVTGYKLGGQAELDDEEKQETLEAMLYTLESTEITDKIIEINLNDITDIQMNYDNRITVSCGSSLDIERKLRLFKEAVTSNSLADNARGTMDLSETGKAIYTP